MQCHQADIKYEQSEKRIKELSCQNFYLTQTIQEHSSRETLLPKGDSLRSTKLSA